MPIDVFLVLASSGLTLIASVLFFVSEDVEPPEPALDPRTLISFCLPPARRQQLAPPPLPRAKECAVDVSNSAMQGVLTLRPSGDEWIVTLDTTPREDSPASQVGENADGFGAVHDLRWHGKAGVMKAVRRSWRQKPGSA